MLGLKLTTVGGQMKGLLLYVLLLGLLWQMGMTGAELVMVFLTKVWM